MTILSGVFMLLIFITVFNYLVITSLLLILPAELPVIVFCNILAIYFILTITFKNIIYVNISLHAVLNELQYIWNKWSALTSIDEVQTEALQKLLIKKKFKQLTVFNYITNEVIKNKNTIKSPSNGQLWKAENSI